MPSPRPTLMLDDDGDILVTDLGLTRLTETLLEEVAQRLRSKLQIFLGEWFLNKLEGIPYHRDILGKKNPNVATIRSIFNSAIQSDEGVEAVQSLELDFDSETRNLRVTFAARLIDGSETGQLIV